MGIFVLIFVNLKDAGIKFATFQKLDKNKKQRYEHQLDWRVEQTQPYLLLLEEQHIIWEIQIFSIRMNQKRKIFSSFAGFPWYEFSKSQSTTEKILSPILRKIFLKYKKKFEKIQPIHILRVPRESVHFYTWLQNETHTHTAIFHFLDEALLLAQEALVYPSLSIVWDDVIFIEVIFPQNEIFQQLKQEFEKMSAIESSVTHSHLSLKLWVAFSIEKIPHFLKEKENRSRKIKRL